MAFGSASRLGVSLFDETLPLEWVSGISVEEKDSIIKVIYRQVLDNAYVLESERLVIPESQLKQGEISVRETEKRFKILVQGGKSGSPRRRSTNEYIVPASKMTPQIQRIHRTNGKIVSITEILSKIGTGDWVLGIKDWVLAKSFPSYYFPVFSLQF
jgi:hypothetical protein